MAMLHVAAMTPTLPRNSTNVPTLLIAITLRTLLVRTPNACQSATQPSNWKKQLIQLIA